jgi:hypothetical protein
VYFLPEYEKYAIPAGLSRNGGNETGTPKTGDCVDSYTSRLYIYDIIVKNTRGFSPVLPSGGTSGAVAQLGERLVRNEEVSGSIPLSSTIKPTTCIIPFNPPREFVSLFVS